MDARNDVTIRGVALAEAMMSILPRTVAGELGTVLLRPGTELGTVLLDAFYASAPVPAEGSWVDAVEVNARILRGFISKKPPAEFRLVFFEGRLTVNNSTIDAKLATMDTPDPVPPKVWSKRRKMPWVGVGVRHSRFR
jgi:hypothetical protein